MPCYDGDPRIDWDERHAFDAARLLCEAMKEGRVADPSPELKQWWADHQDKDAYYARVLPPYLAGLFRGRP